MLVTLAHTDTQAADLPAVAEWRIPAAREAGSLTVELPRSHPIFAVACWTEDGGFSVSAACGPAGNWTGVAKTVRVDRAGATIEAVDMAGWAAQQPVILPTEFRYATAGAVALAAVRAALTGLSGSPFTPGAFAEAAPPLAAFRSADARTLGDVLAELVELTGQEWSVTPAGRVRWGAPAGVVYPGWLADPGDIREVERAVDASDVVSSVTATGPSGKTATATDATLVDQWPASAGITVQTDDLSALLLAAEAELARRREPAETYTFGLHPRHFALREGDTVRLLLPSAGTRGLAASARVLRRRFDGRTMTVEARRVGASVPPRLAGTTVVRPVSPPKSGDYLRRIADLSSRVAAAERRAGD